MSYCISINSVENLANESTLLIHYNILCSGIWYLQQSATAYRNVCDTNWTLMYPNHQHPRHSDFPISVGDTSVSCTFAWNYGGIPGILAENFDDQHSYLVQIGIFNYNCFNTGNPVDINTGIPEVTGEPIITGHIPIEEPEDGGPGSPPFPGPAGPTGPSSPTPPPPPPPPAPPEPPPPTPLPPGNGSGGTPVGVPGDIDPPISPSPHPIPVDIPPGGIGTIPIDLIPDRPIDRREVYKNSIIEIERPSKIKTGGVNNTNLVFSPIRSPAISNPAPTNNLPNLGTVSQGNEGDMPGNLENSVIVPPNNNTSNNTSIPISIEDSNSILDVQVNTTEIIYGFPLAISCYYLPSVSQDVYGRITINDSSTSVIVLETELLPCSENVPLTFGTTTFSSLFQQGPLVVIAQVFNSADVCIKTNSILAISLPVVNEGEQQNNNQTDEIPSIIINAPEVSIDPVGIELDLPSNENKYVILISDSTQTKFSSILSTDFGNEDKYTLTIYNPNKGFSVSQDFDVTQNAPELILPEEHYSDERFKIDNEEVYVNTHNVGLNDGQIEETQLVVVEISPDINNSEGNTAGTLYVSNSFYLRPVEVISSTTSITAKVPFINEEYGLIIHGFDSNLVEADPIIRSSNSIGSVSWNGLSLSKGMYYSIITKKNGVFNLFSTPIYKNKIE